MAGREGDGFRLARYQIACCAADAVPVVARVVAIQSRIPASEEWVTVAGRFDGTSGDIPVLATSTVSAIPPPEEPLE